MAKKAIDRGKEIVLELVGKAKTPEAKAALTQLGADEELLTMLGDKTLKQDEFSRLANDLKAKEEEFNRTYATVQAHEQQITEHYRQNYKHVLIGQEVEKAGGLDKFLEARIRAAGDTGEEELETDERPRRAAAQPKIDTSKFLTTEQLEARIGQERAAMTAGMQSVTALTSKYALEYYQKYGKALDVPALFNFCNTHKIRLDAGGYEAFTKEDADALAEKELDKKIKEAEDRGAKKALDQMGRGDLPYVVGNGGEGAPVISREPSVLDILKARKAGKEASAAVAGEATSDVMAAVAEYTAGVGRASLGLGRQ